VQQARVRSGSAIARVQQEGAILGGQAHVMHEFEAPQVTACQRWIQAIPMLTRTWYRQLLVGVSYLFQFVEYAREV
jgi:hypothetical protein